MLGFSIAVHVDPKNAQVHYEIAQILKYKDVGRHLIEGLKNPTVVRDKTALEVFPIHPMGVKESIQKAIASTTG